MSAAAVRHAPHVSAAAFAGISAIHVLWATGSSWPLPDFDALTDAVAGQGPAGAPGPLACLGAAGAFATAAAVLAGVPRDRPRIRRAAATGVVAVLTVRGAFGLAGRTDLLVPGSTSSRFRSMDRRFYAPLCVTMAVLALPATAPAATPRP